GCCGFESRRSPHESSMKSLEERIGYKFRNSLLLAEALTHPSLAYETQRPHFDNQRLEFLGDAVLQLVLTEDLYLRFPHFNEGTLTKLRSRLVSRQALQGYASRFNLGEYLLMGKGEEASGGRTRPSTTADAFESLIGAVYLDGGLEAAKAFVFRHCREEIQRVNEEPNEINPKGHLQEVLQAISPNSPVYSIISEAGPDHCKVFRSRVSWSGIDLGKGDGSSKKEAEISAAASALREKKWRTLLNDDGTLKDAKTGKAAKLVEQESTV
ncbi:MAG: ribonuclease III, partial [Verrucomicrobiota bacterium]